MNNPQKLPLEYSLTESLAIYGKRLAVFLNIVLWNFVLLGLGLGISGYVQGEAKRGMLGASIILLVLCLLDLRLLRYPGGRVGLLQYEPSTSLGASSSAALIAIGAGVIWFIFFYYFPGISRPAF